jgi:hypothetical protein
MLIVLAELARLTLLEPKIKCRPSYFSGSVVLHSLEHSVTDQKKCIVRQLQPVSVSLN